MTRGRAAWRGATTLMARVAAVLVTVVAFALAGCSWTMTAAPTTAATASGRVECSESYALPSTDSVGTVVFGLATGLFTVIAQRGVGCGDPQRAMFSGVRWSSR